MHGNQPKDIETNLLQKDGEKVVVDPHKLKAVIVETKIILFFIGLIQHTATVLVMSTASDLSEKFDRPELISFITGCFIALQAVTKFINASFLVQIRHKYRFISALCFLIMGIVVIYLASNKFKSLWICLLGQMIFGVGKALADVVIQGFIKGFPPQVFSGYTIGQGISGILATSYYLILKMYHFKVDTAFTFMIPVYIAFYLIFLRFISIKVKYDEVMQKRQSQASAEQEAAKSNKKLTLSLFIQVLGKTYIYLITLGLGYFFAHSMTSYLLKNATRQMNPDGYSKYTFEYIMIFVQLGIMCSNASLEFFKIKNATLVLLMQFTNFFGFVLYATYVPAPFWILCLQLFLSGIIMGLLYCQVFFDILNSKTILQTEKEVTLNLTVILKDLAVLAHSLAGWGFSKGIKMID